MSFGVCVCIQGSSEKDQEQSGIHTGWDFNKRTEGKIHCWNKIIFCFRTSYDQCTDYTLFQLSLRIFLKQTVWRIEIMSSLEQRAPPGKQTQYLCLKQRQVYLQYSTIKITSPSTAKQVCLVSIIKESGSLSTGFLSRNATAYVCSHHHLVGMNACGAKNLICQLLLQLWVTDCPLSLTQECHVPWKHSQNCGKLTSQLASGVNLIYGSLGTGNIPN